MLRRLLLPVAISCLPLACLKVPPAGAPAEQPRAEPEPEDPAPVLLSPARSIATLYEPGEVREFEIRQGGHLVGHSWGRYVGPVEGQPEHHRFETRVELRLPGRSPIRSEGELVLDAQGHLVRGHERSEAAELIFERREDVIEISDGARKDEIDYRPQTRGSAVMAHSALLHEELMLALRDLHEGTVNWRLVSLSGGPPVQWEGQVEDDAGRVKITTNLGETITLAGGRIEAIEVPASDMAITVAEAGRWPSWKLEGPRRLTYTPPADATFERRDLELPGRDGEPLLAGEVLIPAGASKAKPRPGVVWISGTGQEDRHGFAGPPPVDLGSHEVTDALAQAGFVVLRFDDRGKGRSEVGEMTFSGQVEDARRAIRTLLVQDEVDPDRLVVIGHGEGGLRALHAAAGRGDSVVGIALLATPGRPYREVFLHQARAALEQLPPQLRKEAMVQQKKMLEDIEAGREVPPELAPQAAWIKEALQQKPERLIAAAPGELFLAQGGKDFELDPQADLTALVRAAKKASRPHQVKRYPELDHLFKPEPETSKPERYLEPGRNVDEAFIEDLVAWAKKVTR